jgi:hypothetical protein
MSSLLIRMDLEGHKIDETPAGNLICYDVLRRETWTRYH